MGNGIRYKDDTADLDDGVYFEKRPETGTILQGWVHDAVQGHTDGGQEHKRKCIRVIYSGDYHIDLPVLYKTETMEHPEVAVKDSAWALDDPRELVEWFAARQDTDRQLVRITKYLKAWADERSQDMPTGLELTVLGANENNISFRDGDDECLRFTLENIQTSLQTRWQCVMPTTPKEDLFRGYDSQFKTHFMQSLEDFVRDAKDAVSETDKRRASRLWRKHLGERFPEYEEHDDTTEHKKEKAAAILPIAAASKPWSR